MKFAFLVILCHVSLSLLCQAVIEGKWTGECGVSTMRMFNRSAALNLRYISPRFRWTDEDLTEAEEKHPEEFRKTRIMFELIYGPPIKNLCMGLNVQHRMWKYKKLSMELYGGLKFFFARGPDFAIKHAFVKGSAKGIWYINAGVIAQLNLGIIAPFADIGYDGIVTIGTELNLRTIYKKPKGRYKLHARPVGG